MEPQELLTLQTTLTLACADDAGPWAADVYFVLLARDLYFFSSPKSRHAAAFAHDPRAAGTVHAESEGWEDIRGLQIEGRVEPASEPTTKARALAAYIRKFPFSAALLEAGLEERVRLYRFVPHRVFLVDNEQGLGHREEIDW